MARTIKPKPLTPEGFAPFGDVIEAGPLVEQRIINEGFTTRFHDLARLELTATGGRPGVSIFRSAPRSMPITLSVMERHVKSSQTFVPLDSKPYLVAVAAAGDLMPDAISVFVARPDQGVNYHAGTWHHYSLALGEQSNFLVIDRVAEDEDCDEVMLAENEQITLDLSDIL